MVWCVRLSEAKPERQSDGSHLQDQLLKLSKLPPTTSLLQAFGLLESRAKNRKGKYKGGVGRGLRKEYPSPVIFFSYRFQKCQKEASDQQEFFSGLHAFAGKIIRDEPLILRDSHHLLDRMANLPSLEWLIVVLYELVNMFTPGPYSTTSTSLSGTFHFSLYFALGSITMWRARSFFLKTTAAQSSPHGDMQVSFCRFYFGTIKPLRRQSKGVLFSFIT